MVGERADAATIARLRAELRLDDPLPVQFGHYAGGVVRGDLGRSYITGRPIVRDIAERFPKTLLLAGAAMVLAGGLRPETVAESVALVRPEVVDVSSGVETLPGIKDPVRIAAFLEAAFGPSPIA
jgi:hypothetical protein